MLNVLFGHSIAFFALGLSWGMAIAVVAISSSRLPSMRYHYDHWDARAMLVAPIYPVLFWLVSASAAISQQISALIRGPRERRVVWDIPRERVDSTSP